MMLNTGYGQHFLFNLEHESSIHQASQYWCEVSLAEKLYFSAGASVMAILCEYFNATDIWLQKPMT